ncbi:hypothetical protein CAPTEDRAFT_214886 [Capitella teleta]|uniref:Uncharacterized protein n=1 Tax=Capitella teleta TaxID=283909 RepID=R7UEI6_CAPTE|nr:hypothetical protein CAPTEDRAFT_214886 [Capitella teleta]|eukprot:ELU01687.1 hypothetical protein CAPTEDRAFT_214886 [Capitella teleta]
MKPHHHLPWRAKEIALKHSSYGNNVWISSHKPLKKKQDKLVPYILKSLDDAGLKAYNAFQLSEEDKKNPAKIYEKFEELLNISKPNFRAARLDYFYMRQQKEETLDAFYIRCREKAKTCDFEPEEEKEFFLILLVASTPLKDFQKWLISQKKTVTLEKVLAVGRSYEAQAINVKHIHEREKTSVEVAAKSNNSRKTRPRRLPTPHRGSHKSRQRKVDVVAYDTEEEITEYEYDSIGVGDTVAIEGIRNEAYAKIAFRLNSEDRCRRTIKVKVDTGAQGNTLPLMIYHQLFPDDIGTDGLPSKKTQAKARNVRLKAYNGILIPCFGQVRLQCRDHNSRWSSQTFFVVDVEGPAVAGLPMVEELGLVILSCNITTDTVVQNPSQVMFDRPVMDTLPSRHHYTSSQKEGLLNHVSKAQAHQKQWHDRQCKELPTLYLQQRVTVVNQQTSLWEPATVIERLSDRSYLLERNGREIRRNRSHIRETPTYTPVITPQPRITQTSLTTPPQSPTTTPPQTHTPTTSSPAPIHTPVQQVHRKSALKPPNTQKTQPKHGNWVSKRSSPIRKAEDDDKIATSRISISETDSNQQQTLQQLPWVKDILQKGYKKELDLGDLYEVTHLDKSRTVYGHGLKSWQDARKAKSQVLRGPFIGRSRDIFSLWPCSVLYR